MQAISSNYRVYCTDSVTGATDIYKSANGYGFYEDHSPNKFGLTCSNATHQQFQQSQKPRNIPGAWFYEVGDDEASSGSEDCFQLQSANVNLQVNDVTKSCSVNEIKGHSYQHLTETVGVPTSEHVAEIVGRQGCKIKALRAKTNTYIKTPVRGELPFFVVTGRKEDIMEAKREIECAAEHFTQIRASRSHNQGAESSPGHITAYVRYIITPSREREPIFEVTGLPQNVESARREIEAHIFYRTGNMPITDPSVSLSNYKALITQNQGTLHSENSSCREIYGTLNSASNCLPRNAYHCANFVPGYQNSHYSNTVLPQYQRYLITNGKRLDKGNDYKIPQYQSRSKEYLSSSRQSTLEYLSKSNSTLFIPAGGSNTFMPSANGHYSMSGMNGEHNFVDDLNPASISSDLPMFYGSTDPCGNNTYQSSQKMHQNSLLLQPYNGTNPATGNIKPQQLVTYNIKSDINTFLPWSNVTKVSNLIGVVNPNDSTPDPTENIKQLSNLSLGPIGSRLDGTTCALSSANSDSSNSRDEGLGESPTNSKSIDLSNLMSIWSDDLNFEAGTITDPKNQAKLSPENGHSILNDAVAAPDPVET